ncbi:MAG: insulinase family protein, partial [Acidobacteriota bacterium]
QRDIEIRPKVQNNFRYDRADGDFRNSYILFSFRMPGFNSPDYPVLEVLNAMIGTGSASMLTGLLDNQKHILFEGTSDLRSDAESGYLSIEASVPPENIDRGELAILVELEILKRKAPEEADMERAFAQLERTYREHLQTVSGRAWMLAQYELQDDWRRIDRRISEIRRVKATDIQRVAVKYFNLKNCTLLEYLPATSNTQNRTLKSVQGTLEALLRAATDEALEKREKEIGYPLDIPDRDESYRFSWIRYPFRTASVLRGPEIYIREDHTTPLIHLGFFYPGGILHETNRQSGITNMMVSLMLRGTSKRSPYEFNRQLEVYGGRIQPVVEDDFFGFYFSIPSKNFRAGFDLLAELIKSPAFNTKDVEWQRSVLEAKLRRYREDRDRIHAALLPDLFRRFPYSRDPLGNSESLAGIDENSLSNWFKLYEKTIEDVWEKNRSLVSLGFQAPPIGDPDLPATMAICNQLDWKVRTDFREEGLTEDAGIGYEPKLRGGSFIGYAIVNPGTETETLERLGLEFQKSVTGSYSYRDFRSAVNSAVGRFRIRQQQPLNQIEDVALTVLAGEGIEGYRSFLSKLQAVKEQDIQYAADRIINMERAVSLRLYGDKSAENIPVPEKPVPLED